MDQKNGSVVDIPDEAAEKWFVAMEVPTPVILITCGLVSTFAVAVATVVST
jgi:hypothetical protein